jgi:hypothetical protein
VSVRTSSLVLGIVGVILIVLAVLGRYLIAPIVTKLPADTDTSLQYSGKATMLDSKALASGDIAHALQADIPVTADRRIQVTDTDGDTAIVKDSLTLHVGGQSQPSSHLYALDRTSLEGVAGPDGTSVEPSKGALSSAFPIGPKSSSSEYTYYDAATRAIVPVRYTGTAKRHGRSTNVYKFDVAGPVKDPALLTALPKALPKALVAGLAPLLPAAVRDQFTPATVAALPALIPLTYTDTTKIVAYVDKQTGVAIEQTISQKIIANAALGTAPVPLLPASAVDLAVTSASSDSLADKARSAGRLLILVRTGVPVALLVIGVLLIVVAVLRRKKPGPDSAGPGPVAEEPAVAGESHGLGTSGGA